MKKVRINSSERMITIGDILSFEKIFNIVITSSLKRLYLKYNGGEVEFLDASTYDFASIKYGGFNIEDVINMHQIIEQNIPEGYLPIALDWSDNPITINTNEGNQKGEIVKFYFDTDEAPEIIAHSLEELLGVTSIDEL